jgi:hypothetical protein
VQGHHDLALDARLACHDQGLVEKVGGAKAVADLQLVFGSDATSAGRVDRNSKLLLKKDAFRVEGPSADGISAGEARMREPREDLGSAVFVAGRTVKGQRLLAEGPATLRVGRKGGKNRRLVQGLGAFGDRNVGSPLERLGGPANPFL